LSLPFERNARTHLSGRLGLNKDCGSALGLGLLETKATGTFFPLPTLLEEIDPLETLKNIALRGYLAGTFKRCMLAHFLLFLSTGA
jgi:hypothetical protein